METVASVQFARAHRVERLFAFSTGDGHATGARDMCAPTNGCSAAMSRDESQTNDSHGGSPVLISARSRRVSTADLTDWDGHTAAESATTGKALVRAVAQGRGGFPGGVRQCSGKQRERSIRPFRCTSKGREESLPPVAALSSKLHQSGLAVARCAIEVWSGAPGAPADRSERSCRAACSHSKRLIW